MPSSTARGPILKFLRIAKSLCLLTGATFIIEAGAAPASGEKGQLYVGTDGKLYIHNGTAFVVVGTQA